jgi:hypothetical protein
MYEPHWTTLHFESSEHGFAYASIGRAPTFQPANVSIPGLSRCSSHTNVVAPTMRLWHASIVKIRAHCFRNAGWSSVAGTEWRAGTFSAGGRRHCNIAPIAKAYSGASQPFLLRNSRFRRSSDYLRFPSRVTTPFWDLEAPAHPGLFSDISNAKPRCRACLLNGVSAARTRKHYFSKSSSFAL